MLRPTRGGFLRPFGCAWFIREFLAGHGPEGSPKIDPSIGAPQTDIFSAYKDAQHRAFAGDMVAREAERRIEKGLSPLTAEETERKLAWYMERIPMKFTRMRYHSFNRYFHNLKELGWVEETKREPSGPQEYYDEFPSRIYYRLTDAGKAATTGELSDPLQTLYNYPKEIRRGKRHKYYTPR
jgi:DNA-binding PadR family transcriptional regulator